MTDFYAAWDQKRNPAPAAAPTSSSSAPISNAYAAAALEGEVANLLSVPIGSGRNDQLNRSAVKMYGYALAGAIDERTVTETLGAADGGLNYPATARTLQSARDAVYGRLGPKHMPESARQQEAVTWQSSDPFAEHYRAPSPSPRAESTNTSSSGNTTDATAAGSSESAADAATSTTQTDPAHDALVILEASKLRLRRDAARLVDAEDALGAFRIPPYLDTLTDELQIPDEPVAYLIDQLMPMGANVLLTAEYKTGKTTFINNVTKALADRESFLNKYGVAELDGRIAIFNYEVDDNQYRRWLRDVGILHTDRVSVLNLRGYRLPLGVPYVETWIVEYLKRAEAAMWIVDPFARAFTGGNENDNGEAGVFLDTLDVIKNRAGVSGLILPNHTGRAELEQGAEHGRGATRLDDWADVRWLLTKDKGGTRFFRASGRDVETEEQALAFDEPTRRLRLTGGDRVSMKRERYRAAVLACVENLPGAPTATIRASVREQLGHADNAIVTDTIASLIAARKMHIRKVATAVWHYAGPDLNPENPFG